MNISKVLRKHAKYLRGEEGGEKSDLQYADLRNADLQGANLQSANLQSADLQGATLRNANLRNANLRYADLQGAHLWNANLQYAYLQNTNLQGANLQGANLQGANLQGAYLWNADLQGANLRNVDLQCANLQGANLQGANLQGAKLSHFQIPEGDLIVYKKAAGHIIKLLIPKEAKRTASLVGRKCRAEYAQVLDISGDRKPVVSDYWDAKVKYKVGYMVRPDKYDDDIKVECSNGIHFFLTRQEAEEY